MRSTRKFLLGHFDTSIYILEADRSNSQLKPTVVPLEVKVTFVEDFDPTYYRTYYFNKMLMDACTPSISVWETDVIVPPDQIL